MRVSFPAGGIKRRSAAALGLQTHCSGWRRWPHSDGILVQGSKSWFRLATNRARPRAGCCKIEFHGMSGIKVECVCVLACICQRSFTLFPNRKPGSKHLEHKLSAQDDARSIRSCVGRENNVIANPSWIFSDRRGLTSLPVHKQEHVHVNVTVFRWN